MYLSKSAIAGIIVGSVTTLGSIWAYHKYKSQIKDFLNSDIFEDDAELQRFVKSLEKMQKIED